ncbi:Putative syntaxin-24 [Glycine soja]|uniref:Putative syntaxin-24 n=1 Tax=Glycine soja TaxID=3848 RepID=A0A0B2RF52_GLYSO|nr:Putative syntaxin-24 [Glycine soja]
MGTSCELVSTSSDIIVCAPQNSNIRVLITCTKKHIHLPDLEEGRFKTLAYLVGYWIYVPDIYYDKVEALAFYEDARFANYDMVTHMNSFRQYKKITSPMSAVFSGQKVLMLNNEQASKLNQDKSDGVYDIYVKLNFRIRFRLGDSISRHLKPKVKCHLKVPSSKSGTFTLFQTTKCSVHF